MQTHKCVCTWMAFSFYNLVPTSLALALHTRVVIISASKYQITNRKLKSCLGHKTANDNWMLFVSLVATE